MATETYQYLFATGSGSEHIMLTLDDDGTFRGSVSSHWMTDESKEYEFAGIYTQISETYGWMRIQEIQDIVVHKHTAAKESNAIPVGVIDTPLLCEYVKVARSSLRHHPDPDIDATYGWGVARWNEEFDLLLIIPPHVFTSIDFLLNEGPSDLIPEELVTEQYNDQAKHIERLLTTLDKKKFQRRA